VFPKLCSMLRLRIWTIRIDGFRELDHVRHVARTVTDDAGLERNDADGAMDVGWCC
jgi:hypothetical protein